MLHLASGREIGALLEQVVSRARDYRRIVTCSPFIDEYGRRLLDRLYDATNNYMTRFEIISTPLVVAACAPRWPGREGFHLYGCAGLHAKLYVAIGLRAADNVAIVTSANLTAAGLTHNVECGVRIAGSTKMLAALVERIPARVGLHNQLARAPR